MGLRRVPGQEAIVGAREIGLWAGNWHARPYGGFTRANTDAGTPVPAILRCPDA